RFRGRTGPYLEPPSGEPQHDLLKMARPGLVADLRIALAQAKKDGTTVRRTGVRVEQNGSARTCDLVVMPLVSPPDLREPLFAVLFEEPRAATVMATPDRPEVLPDVGDHDRAAKLTTELDATKAYLQSVIEEHQRTND